MRATLLDGTVLIAGGSYAEGAAANGNIAELNSAEIFDPAAGTIVLSASPLSQGRAGHQAFLLPNNNNVLLVGGSYNGTDLASSELYTPWLGQFAATGAMSTARASATGAALFPMADGQLLVAGGSNQSSAELYGFATVETDQSDYAPGTPVIISGSGWQPGESVNLFMQAIPDTANVSPLITTTADAGGNILDGAWAPDETDLGARFYLTAAGASSGAQAQNTFTDANHPTTAVTINGGGNVTLDSTGQTIFACSGGTGACGSFTSGTSKSITCNATCTVTWNGNYSTRLVASAPSTGIMLSSWGGACSGTSGSYCNNISGSGSGSVAVTANFVPLTITAVSPNTGPTTGGTIVTITGVNLAGTNIVKFGSNLATSFTVNSNTQITATSPVGLAGTWHIWLQNNGFNSDSTAADQFTYINQTAPTITSDAYGSFTVTQPGTFTVTATGSPTPTITESGALPNGLTFSNGVLSGTPALGSVGTYNITFTASNGVNPNATQNFTLTVSKTLQSQVTITGMPTQPQPYGATFTVGSSGGTGTGDVTFVALDSCSVNANTGLVTITGASGECRVYAEKAADANYYGITGNPGEAH